VSFSQRDLLFICDVYTNYAVIHPILLSYLTIMPQLLFGWSRPFDSFLLSFVTINLLFIGWSTLVASVQKERSGTVILTMSKQCCSWWLLVDTIKTLKNIIPRWETCWIFSSTLQACLFKAQDDFSQIVTVCHML